MITFADRLRETADLARMRNMFGEHLLCIDRILSPSGIEKARAEFMNWAALGRIKVPLITFNMQQEFDNENSILSRISSDDEERASVEKFAHSYNVRYSGTNMSQNAFHKVLRSIVFFRFDQEFDIETSARGILVNWEEPATTERYDKKHYDYFCRLVEEAKPASDSQPKKRARVE